MLLCTIWQGAPLPNAMSDVFFVAAMYYYLRQNELVNREVSSRRASACRHLLAVLRCPCVHHMLLTREDLPHVRVRHPLFLRKTLYPYGCSPRVVLYVRDTPALPR